MKIEINLNRKKCARTIPEGTPYRSTKTKIETDYILVDKEEEEEKGRREEVALEYKINESSILVTENEKCGIVEEPEEQADEEIQILNIMDCFLFFESDSFNT